MADRRMLSKRIVSSAKFLRMPVSSQNLYFHLNVNADDDGVVEAYPIMKMCGSNDDDLKVLATKEFIKVLNEDFVSYILDWHEHNLLRSDRKTDSIYQSLLVEVIPDVYIMESTIRADVKKKRQLKLNSGQPVDVQRTAKDRLGKDRLGEDSNINDELSKRLLVKYNEVFGKKVRSTKGFEGNLKYWLEDGYTEEDMLKAIETAKEHHFWSDKINPTILFRRKNPRGENVDYIGEMLNYTPKKSFASENTSKYKDL